MYEYRKSIIPSVPETLTGLALALLLATGVLLVPHFRHPVLLSFLGLGPLLILFFRIAGRAKVKALDRLAEAPLAERLNASVFPGSRRRRRLLQLSAALFLGFGLARPVWNRAQVETPVTGIDVMVVIDTSLSMLAQDILPSRLGRARAEIQDLIAGLRGDRIGITVFAGEATLACPLTLDTAAAALFLRDLDTDSVAQRGTNIGEALRVAAAGFSDTEKDRQKVILLITDGEDLSTRSDPILSARAAADLGIRIHTVSIGDSSKGTPIPLVEGDVAGGWKRDDDGRIVFTRPNPELVETIAETAGGRAFHAAPGQTQIAAILDLIRDEEAKKIAAFLNTQRLEQFQWFIATALIALVVESLLGDRRRRHSALLVSSTEESP